ncbi:MAG: SDR family NAD(P)-dependent oxidoreductase [Actinobacteria bacterium]|nr:SDR family NAD(P)-dependent oxidoreductase [Actinomycetota bacterium]MCB8995847.1 SDR family NAD(P)-dependent oxidoreductase [Actinomycetota bacterium]HRY08454.1 SDR family NAD(P)-dependent oxidoreductase [Candidatus Nanopelagicales bacterium]
MHNVEGKNVLITGAAMGLGRLFAERAVAEGAAAVVLWDVNEQALVQTADELQAAGGSVYGYIVDVSSADEIEATAAIVREEIGEIDVLFNNAGIVRGNSYFWEVDDVSQIQLTMAINSVAPMLVSREFLPGMIAKTSECRIVNIASSAGLVSNPRMSVYAASKWAAIGWSDSVRLELEQAGYEHIKITTVCPTYINTGMFDGAKKMLMTPMLEQEVVVDSTWKEMLRGGPFLLIPWTAKLNKVLSGILPVGIRDFVLDKAGVYHSMEEFQGHDDLK